VRVPAKAIRALRERLVSLDQRARLRLPGMDRRRADILPAGAIVLDEILTRLGAKEILLSEWALREGLLLDFAANRRSALRRAEEVPDVRRRSVLDLADRFTADRTHARHVARLALALFDATRSRHGGSREDRTLLEYAALLHDIGEHIAHRQHHKHSFYLIQNAELRGFDPREIELIANVARYHRGSSPGKKHLTFATLRRRDRARVELLASMLRMAEALDRSHRQRMRAIARIRGAGPLRLRLESAGNVDLEAWGARRHLPVLERALGEAVELRFDGAAARRTA
jgi:exopolyphosphatase/guanosine-5'-triphosphate,3'-diphosphate pyrophosphatase